MIDYQTIAQVVSFFVAGIGAAAYVDRKISATEKRLTSKIANTEKILTEKVLALEKKLEQLDQKFEYFVPRRECTLINRNIEQRLDNLEDKLGEIAQKAQIIVSTKELAKAAVGEV